MRIKGVFINFSLLILFPFLISCSTGENMRANSVEYAEEHMEGIMDSFIWENDRASIQITNKRKNEIIYSSFIYDKTSSVTYNYTVLPFIDEEYVRLSLVPLDSSLDSLNINELQINLSGKGEDSLKIIVNKGEVLSFNKKKNNPFPKPDSEKGENPEINDNSNPSVPDGDNSTPDIPSSPSEDNNTPSGNIPEIVGSSAINSFRYDLFSYDYGTNDYEKRTYRIDFYPYVTRGEKYFVYEYKYEGTILHPESNLPLKSPKVMLYFNENYYEKNNHLVLDCSLINAFLKSGNKEDGYEYFSFNDLSGFIKNMTIEILYNSPSSYHVIINDDKGRINKKENWVKLNKTH